jgi:hypothetical protein
MSEDGWGELSPERIGKATASRISDVIAKTKSGYGASRANYAAELVAERLTGVQYSSGYENAAMKWGRETEPLARVAYEFHTDNQVEKAGFVIHPTIPMSGASPDGLVQFASHPMMNVGANLGLVEIKCPTTATHIATLRGEPLADKYYVQVQWQMACTKRLWTDWVSFDPRLPEEMRLFVARIPLDRKRVHELEDEVTAFLAEVEATVIFLKAKYQKVQAA